MLISIFHMYTILVITCIYYLDSRIKVTESKLCFVLLLFTFCCTRLVHPPYLVLLYYPQESIYIYMHSLEHAPFLEAITCGNMDNEDEYWSNDEPISWLLQTLEINHFHVQTSWACRKFQESFNLRIWFPIIRSVIL